ncbi:MAG: AAA family ATPase [Lachnospiraceae bacterium]|nr:AAA family ATPase [Lachnospiraceae bacterium]
MGRTIGIGIQDFADIRRENLFYIDKTLFVKEWWDNRDSVTLITRPRRFGKTLTMSMVEQFFSVKYAGQADLFDGLAIWQEERYRSLQGTYPVISLSFANVKEKNYQNAREKICLLLVNLYGEHSYLLDSDVLTEKEREFFLSVSEDMTDVKATMAIYQLSGYLSRYYGKKVIILLDEYDTPMQEAYINGFWEELAGFTRSLFNSTFKTNSYLERAIMTGITRVSKESIFSDLNNLVVVTTTSDLYAEYFGFTEREVFDALEEFGLSDQKQKVKEWYDGFIFGHLKDVYNPWSILNYLRTEKFFTYWANTSSNSLAGKLIQEGSRSIKQSFETLMRGETLTRQIDEQIVYNQLDQDEASIWSLLLASGYLRVKNYRMINSDFGNWTEEYELELTNFEVKVMFRNMIRGWFGASSSDYNDFVKALLLDDIDAMNEYMNRVALSTFSYFDTGKRPSGQTEPERFYHGFVLGLMVELEDQYRITSNRESGFGRYDIMLEPKKCGLDGIIMEFKVRNARREDSLEETAAVALEQIEKQQYVADMIQRGVPEDKIRKYGFAFEGKQVLIEK